MSLAAWGWDLTCVDLLLFCSASGAYRGISIYTHSIDLIFSFLMVFILSQLDIYCKSYDILSFLVYKKSKIFV